MMHFLFMMGFISGLKVSQKFPTEKEYELCSHTSVQREVEMGWRVRAICNEDNSDRLEDYLEVSRSHTESMSLETADTEGKNRRRKKSKGNRRRKNNGGNRDKTIIPEGTLIYIGRYCAQGEHSELGPIVNFTYGLNASVPSTEFKIAAEPICYIASCSGRCDRVDPSVQFSCVAGKDADGNDETDAATFSKLKATWFLKAGCEESTTTKGALKDAKDTDDDTEVSADGTYYYTKAQVLSVNKGFNSKFCWDTGVPDSEENSHWNSFDADDWEEYYYSFSSAQKLPTCPPAKEVPVGFF